MPTKTISVLNNFDMSNPQVQTDFVFVNGVGVEIQRGKQVQVRPVYQEILVESQQKTAKFNTPNMNVSGNIQEYNSI